MTLTYSISVTSSTMYLSCNAHGQLICITHNNCNNTILYVICNTPTRILYVSTYRVYLYYTRRGDVVKKYIKIMYGTCYSYVTHICVYVLWCTFPMYMYSKFLHKNHKQEIKVNNHNRAQSVNMVLILLVHTCDSFYARARSIV